MFTAKGHNFLLYKSVFLSLKNVANGVFFLTLIHFSKSCYILVSFDFEPGLSYIFVYATVCNCLSFSLIERRNPTFSPSH